MADNRRHRRQSCIDRGKLMALGRLPGLACPVGRLRRLLVAIDGNLLIPELAVSLLGRCASGLRPVRPTFELLPKGEIDSCPYFRVGERGLGGPYFRSNLRLPLAQALILLGRSYWFPNAPLVLVLDAPGDVHLLDQPMGVSNEFVGTPVTYRFERLGANRLLGWCIRGHFGSFSAAQFPIDLADLLDPLMPLLMLEFENLLERPVEVIGDVSYLLVKGLRGVAG